MRVGMSRFCPDRRHRLIHRIGQHPTNAFPNEFQTGIRPTIGPPVFLQPVYPHADGPEQNWQPVPWWAADQSSPRTVAERALWSWRLSSVSDQLLPFEQARIDPGAHVAKPDRQPVALVTLSEVEMTIASQDPESLGPSSRMTLFLDQMRLEQSIMQNQRPQTFFNG